MKETIEKLLVEKKETMKKLHSQLEQLNNNVRQTEVTILQMSGYIAALEELLKPVEPEVVKGDYSVS